jgi:gamma-glutamyl:cysteine ligase YbdK (ATP-grasp superfamily)
VRRLLVVALLVPLLAGCGGDPKEDYCDAVKDHQTELSDIVSTGEPDALINALDIFHDLQDKAPGDITDEWQQLVGRIEALRDALDDAGVDPATYDRENPPEGVTAEQRARIDAAAKELGSGTTLRALQDLGQEARDVCKTPLTL